MPDEIIEEPGKLPKTILDDLDRQGRSLSELLVFTHGPPVERAAFAAQGIKLTFAPKKKYLHERWFAKHVYLLPKACAPGARFVRVEVRGMGPGPEHERVFWTLAIGIAPDDEPPDDVRAQAFPGTFPDNLSTLLQLGRIDGIQDLRVRGRYLARRVRIPATVETIAPWLASTPPPDEFFPRRTEWEVAGYPTITHVTLQEIQYDGCVLLKVAGEVRTTITIQSVDEIDARLWADLSTFMTANDRGIVKVETTE